MGQWIKLKASDGHELSAYEVAPQTAHHRGGLVVIQEIFGVNAHIRSVADGWAAEGYYCIAPAIFDRAERGVEIGYSPDEIAKGRNLAGEVGMDKMLLDVEAARAAAASAGKVGVVGYCLGGSLAWLAATQIAGSAAASCYYGGRIPDSASEKPRCPVQMHFGETDQSIPMSAVEKVRAAVPPSVEVFTYPGAGHAFNRDGSANWEPQAAKLAKERTLALFRKHIG
ncbi:MAG: dienelactone hydrolase family protein [Propylenella sp.]